MVKTWSQKQLLSIINLCEVWMGQTKWYTIAHAAQKPQNWLRDWCYFWLQLAALHSFIMFKNTMILLDCVQKMTELAQREVESDGEDNESLACNMNSSDKTTMQMTISDSFGWLYAGWTSNWWFIKRFMFHKVKKRKMQPWEYRVCSAHKQIKETSCMWYFTIVCALTNTACRKLLNRYIQI